MIIKLKGADFSGEGKHIATLTTWSISKALGSGVDSNTIPSSVTKGAALNATVTLKDGYEIGTAGVTVTMVGSGDITSTAVTTNGNTITIAIASVTGNVTINVPTKNTSTGEEGSGEVVEPDTPDQPTTVYTVTKGSAYAASTASSANRASINPVTIKIPNGVTITPKDGYKIGIFYAVNPDDPTNGFRCPDGWKLTEWTGNGVTTIGLSIKKSDDSDFSDSDFGKPISDFVDATDTSIWEVKEEVVPTQYTLYAGNWFDDSASSNQMQNRATHDPYTIVVPSGVVITPKSGYQISVWSGLNKYDIPTPEATFTAWSSEAYTGDGSEVGICIRKTDNNNFDFATESTFIGDYLDSTDISIWEVK